MMYRINSKVLQTPVTDGNILLLEPVAGLYFELNDTSAMIYQAIDQNLEINKIADMLVSNYEIDYKTALTDINSLIEQLLENNIIY